MWREMANERLSPADRALRARITELSVHIPCGGIRGPLQRTARPYQGLYIRWQSCPHEDSPERWSGCDVSRQVDLCIICFRATAGGTSRWSWVACEECRSVNRALETHWGFRPFALGRHSLMNGIGVRGGSPPNEVERQSAQLNAFMNGESRLKNWRELEYGRLAAKFDPLADVPLRIWQKHWPPGKAATLDAFERLVQDHGPLPPALTR